MEVGIVGGSGYGGAELVRLLDDHPVLKPSVVAARSSAGRAVGEVFPHLAGTAAAGLLLSEPDIDVLDGCAVVFLATPHEVSLAMAPPLVQRGVPVVDLSGAFRLDAETFAEAYGQPHTAPGLTPGAYGLPELYRGEIARAPLVANPGCYPTAALLALAPLAGLVDPGSVIITGLSGTSGAGKGLRDDLHASHAIGNVAPYAAPGHRHTPEIARAWGGLTGLTQAPPLTFVPHLVPASRGQLCTVVADLAGDPSAVHPAFQAAYGNEPFVHLLPESVWPATAHTLGANTVHIGVAVDRAADRVLAVAALDNLVKGASGQALQNANLLLGLAETSGLPLAGIYP